ncbi:hypothetical protein [Desulfofundulus thermosubterraneus]|uniref:ABC-2 family transporter protein n=1 Tax=Desulfofundulus thermosubterraneus DSM 16057 TaxID=1121432 RepID=A0A1M6LNL9_9FIRM|nr:hypothetical protein [Desulfofundulus thermosubterraneus]SHJ72786.1 hypothetical protein SAMN02745219_03203 [Desulfofundulus thermosubterraneus DSM 16057]
MINGPFLRWEIRRLRWWYYGVLLFWLGNFIFTLCLIVPGQPVPVHWEHVDFLWFGMFWAIFWGGGLFVGKFRDGTMEFLLARPVSRREVYHSIVLAGGIPIVFLVILPSLFALTLPPWKTSHLFPGLLALNLLESVWLIAVFLLSACVYLFTGNSNRRYARFIEASFIGAAVAVLIELQKTNLPQLIQAHPLASLLLSLTAGCLFYGLGRWRFERMDILTNSG